MSRRANSTTPFIRPQSLLHAAGVCSALFSPVVQAQEHWRAYADAGLGRGHLQTRCENTVFCDRGSFGLLLGVGAELPLTLGGGRPALELRWLQTDSYALASTALRAEVKARAPMLGLSWWRPLSPRWTVGLGGGAAHVNAQAKLTITGGQPTLLSDRRVQPYWMLAVQMKYSPSVQLQATLLGSRLRFSDGGVDLYQGRLRMVSLGVSHAF